ncbi:MAG TPA: AAA family ATPase [Candidatus Paceibacterota bacterium]|nr:AAA family ATPase [Candidatus Paceibacterota bacterium]
MTQAEALSILQTGANAFLTGEPGSGKTHTVNTYVAWLRARGIEPAITASTGIAATHVGGMTIHSWSGIGIRDYLSEADVDMIASKEHVARRINRTNVLIIDEISMLSGNVLSMVDRIVREVRRTHLPFGGMQVVAVGDFFQLPPVTKGSASPLFAFESPSWRALNPLVLYLTEQHRHDDPKFAAVLGSIRRGESDQGDVARIVSKEASLEDVADDVPRLYTHNADVDKENAEKLEGLKGSSKRFTMESNGSEVLVEALKRGCLSPEALELKVGAVVMFTKNNPLAGYVNGTLGVVLGFERGTNWPLVETRDGRTITAAPQEWVVEEQGKIRAKVIQVPLKLAWAITIHKSQGQSLDAAAVDLSRAFEYGQGYVALSRLRTLEGLHLLGWSENALRIHPTVQQIDKEFRAASEAAQAAFGELERTGERTKLEENFLRACGGSLTPTKDGEPRGKRTTHDETLSYIQEGKPLAAIADARSLTFGTIAEHVEELIKNDRLTREEVEPLIPAELLRALPQIFDVFEQVGTERLTPVFARLGKKYPFEYLKIARALYRTE